MIPVVKPTKPTYPFSPALNRFPTAQLGDPNPIDDPTMPRQSWSDPAAAIALASNPGAVMSYFYWDQSTGAQVNFTVPAAQAARANLAGKYDAFVPSAPVGVTAKYPAFPTMNAIALTDGSIFSLPVEAATIAQELGGTVVNGELATEHVDYGAVEQRRILSIQLPPLANGTVLPPVNVGRLLIQQNVNGVGAPGHWTVVNCAPVWNPAVSPSTNIPDTPVPQRALEPNESIISEDIAGIHYFYVANTDNGYAAGGAPSAGLSQAEHLMLAAIYNGLKEDGIIKG